MGSDWDHCINDAVICMIWQIFTVPAPRLAELGRHKNFSPEGHHCLLAEISVSLLLFLQLTQTYDLMLRNLRLRVCIQLIACVWKLSVSTCSTGWPWEMFCTCALGGKKGKTFIFAFCFLWWPEAFIVIRNSSLGKEGKQMVYLYIHNARFLHIIFGEHKVWLREVNSCCEKQTLQLGRLGWLPYAPRWWVFLIPAAIFMLAGFVRMTLTQERPYDSSQWMTSCYNLQGFSKNHS